MKFLVTIFIFLLIACMDGPNSTKRKFYPTYTKYLEDTIRSLDLEYIAWACACANWATPSDIDRYNDSGKLEDHSIFVEPADSTLILPDTLGYSADIIKFTGQFYKEKGYPKNYERTEEPVSKARVFRYMKYQVIRSNYRDYTTDTSTNNK